VSTNETAVLGLTPNTARDHEKPREESTESRPAILRAGRYSPPLVRLLARRRSRIVDAAIRLEAAHEAVLEARYEYGRGTTQCTAAVRRRAEARRSLFYHVRELRREDAS
jgi:hypothetical protein